MRLAGPPAVSSLAAAGARLSTTGSARSTPFLISNSPTPLKASPQITSDEGAVHREREERRRRPAAEPEANIAASDANIARREAARLQMVVVGPEAIHVE